ncbi:hypothetical protein HK102_008255 [Quaeritorhiza haematococci]|nr:hypothetical protein HK102_008255 [Quaeritorhiza haematococci]
MCRASQFLRDELPIRLAHRVVELENLPHDLSAMPSVVRVKDWYTQSFQELIEFPRPEEYKVHKDFIVEKASPELTKGNTGRREWGGGYHDPIREPAKVPTEVHLYNDKFAKCLENIKKRHDPVVTTIAQGILELKEHWRRTGSPLMQPAGQNTSMPLPTAIQSFLDRFYMSRIGIRMLIGQHVAQYKGSTNPTSVPKDYVGIICTRTSLRKIAEEAADNAKFICQDYYGLWSAPEVRLMGKDDVEFSYVPSHLHHMLFELLKNSLRAVVERNGVDCDTYPEIRMVVAEGKEDITIKISDEGGGIPRSGMPLIWTYMYTTAENPMLDEDFNKSDFRAPLAGFGYGLPLSRLYARYFGGDLKLISMEGYGTDAYLHLSRLRLLSKRELESLPTLYEEHTSSPEILRRAVDTIVLQSSAFQSLDPGFFETTSGFDVVTNDIGDHRIIRIRPHIDGRPVVGADRVLHIDRKTGRWVSVDVGPRLRKRGSDEQFLWRPRDARNGEDSNNGDSGVTANFKLSRREAIELANRKIPHLTSTGSVDVDELQGRVKAEQVFFIDHADTIRPAWKVQQGGNILAREIRYLDAETGDVLSVHPAVHHDQGYVFGLEQFKFRERPIVKDLLDVVFPPPTNAGRSIYGKKFRSSNACSAYRCANGTGLPPSGRCEEDGAVCVDVKEGMVEGVDYFTARSKFSTDGRFIDLDRDWLGEGYKDGRIQMVWNNVPVFAPRLQRPADGIWGSDVDFGAYKALETDDSFAELQAYHYFTLHERFMTNLLNVTEDFCLIGTGPNCQQTDPRTNRTATKYDYPIRFVVNLQSMKPFPSKGSPYPDFITQLQQGLGKNETHPIQFYESEPYGDAFFSNSDFQPPVTTTSSNGTSSNSTASFRSNCTIEGECVSIYDSPLTFFAFGQGVDGDWALNDCIVLHELVHAIVAKFIPELPAYVWTDAGITSDPGAMNEAWADYFAAIHCGVSDFMTGTYNGRPRRNLNNNMTCVDVVGQVHNDGMIFSGGLWATRKAIPTISPLTTDHQTLFDKVVLTALMQGQGTDTFRTQYMRVLTLLSDHPVLQPLYPTAKTIFEQRVLNCTRITIYTEKMDSTFTLPPALITSANYSTLPSQLELQPRLSDWGATVQWTQWYVSPLLGPLQVGYGRTRINVAVSYGCPILLGKRERASPDPVDVYAACPNAEPKPLQWQLASYDIKTARGSFYIPATSGSKEKIYVWFAHQVPASMVMFATALTWNGFHLIWLYTQAVVGGVLAAWFFAIGGYFAVRGLWGWCSRRRTKAGETHSESSSSALTTDTPRRIETTTTEVSAKGADVGGGKAKSAIVIENEVNGSTSVVSSSQTDDSSIPPQITQTSTGHQENPGATTKKSRFLTCCTREKGCLTGWRKQPFVRKLCIVHLFATSAHRPTIDTWPPRPLILGVNGPQGCGKTTLVTNLKSYLSSPPHHLSVAVLSMDDLYLTFEEQNAVAEKYPGNPLLRYRGNFGTHDVALGRETFESLLKSHTKALQHLQNNGITSRPPPSTSVLTNLAVSLPSYDKSLHQGRGDRAPRSGWPRAIPPFDVILFEGWSLGFKRLAADELERVYHDHTLESDDGKGHKGEGSRAGMDTRIVHALKGVTIQNLRDINENVGRYVREWYPFIDAFVHLCTEDLAWVYEWRWEQEETMRRKVKEELEKRGSAGAVGVNGGEEHIGLTKEQVNDFVDRFIPCYLMGQPRLLSNGFFADEDGRIPDEKKGRHLKVLLDRNREVLKQQLI